MSTRPATVRFCVPATQPFNRAQFIGSYCRGNETFIESFIEKEARSDSASFAVGNRFSTFQEFYQITKRPTSFNSTIDAAKKRTEVSETTAAVLST